MIHSNTPIHTTFFFNFYIKHKCRFKLLKVKEEDLLHQAFTIAVAHLPKIRAKKEKKSGSLKDGVNY